MDDWFICSSPCLVDDFDKTRILDSTSTLYDETSRINRSVPSSTQYPASFDHFSVQVLKLRIKGSGSEPMKGFSNIVITDKDYALFFQR